MLMNIACSWIDIEASGMRPASLRELAKPEHQRSAAHKWPCHMLGACTVTISEVVSLFLAASLTIVRQMTCVPSWKACRLLPWIQQAFRNSDRTTRLWNTSNSPFLNLERVERRRAVQGTCKTLQLCSLWSELLLDELHQDTSDQAVLLGSLLVKVDQPALGSACFCNFCQKHLKFVCLMMIFLWWHASIVDKSPG